MSRDNEEGLVLIKVSDLDKWRKKELVLVKTSDITKLYKKKQVEIAREIFEEIEKIAMHGVTPFGLCLMSMGEAAFAQLKKKYLGEDINAPTKESEGESEISFNINQSEVV